MTSLHVTRSRPTWISYGQIGAFGWLVYSFGPAMALLSDEQGTTPVVMSLHMSAMAVGTLISGAAASQAVARWGRGRMLRAAGLGIAAAVLVLVLAPSTAVSLSAALAIGLCAAIIVTMTSSFLNTEHGRAAAVAVTEANSGAALSGLISPLVLGALVGAGFGWRPGILVAAVAFVALEIFRGPVNAYSRVEAHHTNTHGPLPALYWWAWLLISCTTGAEFILLTWATDLMRSWGGLGDAAAVASVATFTSGLLLGRLVLGQLTKRFPTERLLLITLLGTMVSFWGFWITNISTVMLIALFFCGVTMAGHWPLGLSRLFKAGGNQPDRASALTAFATGGSSLLLPLLLGVLAQVVDIHTAFLLFPVLLCVPISIVLLRPVR